MATKKRSLGRGLDVLLKSVSQVEPSAAVEEQAGLRQVSVEHVDKSPYQPRLDINPDRLQELADSIRVQGLVQPVVVRPVAEGRYELIAGERRWRAAQLAGLAEIPAVIRPVSDQVALAMALIENIQREDLNPLEEALALKRLIDEFGLTHEQTAEAVGRSRTAVSNLLRLLELDSEVQNRVRERYLEMGHARALLSLPPALQREAAAQVQLRGLSVRETEQLVRSLQQSSSAPVRKPRIDPDMARLEQELAARLGAPVILRHNASGKGQMVIRYNSLDELDGILEQVRGERVVD